MGDCPYQSEAGIASFFYLKNTDGDCLRRKGERNGNFKGNYNSQNI